jgi:hypothetical protein
VERSGVSARTAAARGRLFAARQFESACTIFTSGEQITDPQTGEVVTGQDVIWSGRCRVRPAGGPGGASATRDVAGAQVFTFDYLVTVPFDVAAVIEGHRLTITDSPDPALAGITLEVQHVDRGDSITARRLQCREVV